MRIVAYTDGASRGNPGDAAIGIVLKDDAGTTLLAHRRYIGKTTNNVAEYTALLECLELTAGSETFRCSELVIHTDSELMARQMSGVYKVKDAGLKALFHKAQSILSASPFSFTIRHIPRSLNHEADALANEAINAQQ